jgi:putative ABC transport system permease protein
VIVAGWVPDFGSLPDIYVPSQIDPNSRDAGDGMQVAARLRPGVSIDLARQRLKPLGDQLRREFPSALDPNEQLGAVFLKDAWFGDLRSSAMVFQGAVGLVLLIACVNVANLLLARGEARRRELAFRSWLGASRRRLVRQLVTESFLLAASGSLVGLVIGTLGIKAILAGNPVITDFLAQRLSGAGPDWRVIAFTASLAVITTLLFGLFPALQISGNDGRGRRQSRTRAMLSVGEIAMAVVLLIGAALLLRSFAILRGVAPGFETRNVISMQMSLSDKRFLKTQAVTELTHAGIAAVSAVPGVASVAATVCLPLECTIDLPFIVAGRPLNGWSHGEAFWSPVSERYFETFRIPVVHCGDQ